MVRDNDAKTEDNSQRELDVCAVDTDLLVDRAKLTTHMIVVTPILL